MWTTMGAIRKGKMVVVDNKVCKVVDKSIAKGGRTPNAMVWGITWKSRDHDGTCRFASTIYRVKYLR